jgi:hypothetical protein
MIGKDPNGTLSLVFDGIKRFNRGEKHLKLKAIILMIIKIQPKEEGIYQ